MKTYDASSILDKNKTCIASTESEYPVGVKQQSKVGARGMPQADED